MREVVARLKYRNARAAVDTLASAMARAMTAAVSTSGLDSLAGAVVTWVPAVPQRRRRRGFDHAELLARAVAHHLGLPVRALLVRGDGPAQTGRTRSERARTPISLRLGRAWSRSVEAVPATVILVDDVATTGTSLAAAASVLRAGGVRDVIGLTAARTPPPRLKASPPSADGQPGQLGSIPLRSAVPP